MNRVAGITALKCARRFVFVPDFKNAAEYWLFPYESPTFRYELEGVWEEVRPLYELLHAYVRRKLRDLYGPDKLSRKAPLPAHILGKFKLLCETVMVTAFIYTVPSVGEMEGRNIANFRKQNCETCDVHLLNFSCKKCSL